MGHVHTIQTAGASRGRYAAVRNTPSPAIAMRVVEALYAGAVFHIANGGRRGTITRCFASGFRRIGLIQLIRIVSPAGESDDDD